MLLFESINHPICEMSKIVTMSITITQIQGDERSKVEHDPGEAGCLEHLMFLH